MAALGETGAATFECRLCTARLRIEDMVSMLACEHKACIACTRKYFKNEIEGKSMTVITCHSCRQPEFKVKVDIESADSDSDGKDSEGDSDEDDDFRNDYDDVNIYDDVGYYLSMLDQLLRYIMPTKEYQLYEKKLLDHTLSKDPNFEWCGYCPAGYIVRPNEETSYATKTCPNCHTKSCNKCSLKYKGHENKTCEQVREERRLDAEVTLKGALHGFLWSFGIECPNCKFQFELAKGGCLHFCCIQCRADFCGGCKRDFAVGARCKLSPNCGTMGLHAHHPRNCVYYLRNTPVAKLEELLGSSEIPYAIQPEDVVSGTGCIVMEQQRVNGDLQDVRCVRKRKDYHYCEVHYTEYLCDLIFKNNLDPVNIYTEEELEQEVAKHKLKLPEKSNKYTEDLRALIKKSAPLGQALR